MWAIYNDSDGGLYAVAQSDPGQLPAGRSATQIPGYGEGWEWDPATRTMVAVPVPRYIQTTEFLQRFTPQERGAMYAAQPNDQAIADFLYRIPLHERVDLDSPDVVGGCDYLVSVGILTAARKTEVLA